MRRWAGAAVVAALLAVAIFGVLKMLRPSALPSALPGDGAHVQGPLLVSADPGISSNGMAAIVEGEINYDDGCIRLAGYPVVWPSGTEWDGAAREVVLPNGKRAGVGDSVSGGGGYLRPTVFDADEPYGDEGTRILEECASETGEVAFFNEGSEVELVE